jgi:formylglycine-generating enzyme required for sulfatase activity
MKYQATIPLVILFPSIVMAEKVQIDGFAIDRTEVTVGAFKKYAEASGLKTQAELAGGGYEWGFGWERRSGWTYKEPQGRLASDDEPVVHITWDEAKDYCNYMGGKLPSKREWTLAAYTETRAIPSDDFVRGETYQYPVGNSPVGMNNNKSHHLPVGKTKKGVNGLYDMGGNVWEWLSDREGNEALTAGGMDHTKLRFKACNLNLLLFTLSMWVFVARTKRL